MDKPKQKIKQYSTFDARISNSINYFLSKNDGYIVQSISLCHHFLGSKTPDDQYVMAVVVYKLEEENNEN